MADSAAADHADGPDMPSAAAQRLTHSLDDLLTSLNANELAACKHCLLQGRERIKQAFAQGLAATDLVQAQTQLVDGLLRQLWQLHMAEHADTATLVAVGGYGRCELFPHSDVDLLLLQASATGDSDDALKRFLALLWDVGLEIGHSVRTPDECAEQARLDITVMTNLLEARKLCGNPDLHTQMQALLQPAQLWPATAFFNAKLAEQKQRYAKYDGTAYRLEPNIKEAPGGLRDIHMISWVTRRQLGTLQLDELVTHGFLSTEELQDLRRGREFLWRTRFALHMTSGRREDRLLFEHQIKLAQLFGYADKDNELAVEQFMQRYYRSVKGLSCLNDVLLQLFEEAIVHPDDSTPPRSINARFQSRHGYIEVTDDAVFQDNPSALFEIFHILQTRDDLVGIRARTLRLLRRDRSLIDGARDDLRLRSLFMAMLRHGHGLTNTLRRLNRYGLLGRYIPAFGQVIGRMQFDLFHTLTVDEHTLFVVRNLRRLAMPRFNDELPLCSSIMQRLLRPEWLYLAGLCHDIAKGRGGDHSLLGAQDASELCLQHGISGRGSELVAWLVQNHLLMSMTAQRKDISDPAVIHEFALAVGTVQRLEYLFLLTVSDIRATNPTLWNTWRASLLTQLYQSTRRNLEEGLEAPLEMAGLVEETRSKAHQALLGMQLCVAEVARVWARFDDELFLRHSAHEIAWFTAGILRSKPGDLPLVMVDTRNQRGALVFVYTRDVNYLFGLLAGALTQCGLTIHEARLASTRDGYTLDSYTVTESDSRPLAARDRVEEIRSTLIQAVRDMNYDAARVTRRTPRLLRLFTVPTQVDYSQDIERKRTIVELVTADRTGLLFTVGKIFRRHNVLVQDAKINTIGERAEDVFFVTDLNHRPITSQQRLNDLRDELTATIDYEENL